MFWKAVLIAASMSLSTGSLAGSAKTARAPAAETDAPRGDPSTRIVLLGTAGGPAIQESRSQPATLLIVDGTAYLIDAGEAVVTQLRKAGVRPADVCAVFITHHHTDHNAGLAPLISLTWANRFFNSISGPPEQIYGPPETEFLVGLSLDFLSVSQRIFRAGIDGLASSGMFQAHDITHDGIIYRDAKLQVTAVENTHFRNKSKGTSSQQDRSYSYRFDTAHGSVVFTGDTGPSEALTKLAEGADVLVSEIFAPLPDGIGPEPTEEDLAQRSSSPIGKQMAFHMLREHLLPEEVGKMASKAHVKEVILTHFVPGNGIDTRYTRGVKKYFPGTVIAGRDLFEYDLY